MLYNNLIYFLIVIFAFSTDTPPAEPWIAPILALPALAVLLGLYSKIASGVFRKIRPGSAASYFTAEKKLSILAIFFFLAALFALDFKYYLQPLSFDSKLPILENICGLALFFTLLSLMWARARKPYELVFQRSYTASRFILHNIKANLPIILPWLVLSLVFDLLALYPNERFQQFLVSPWGDLLLFTLFVGFLALFFPPLIIRLWNCRRMEDGPLLQHMQNFCRQQNFQSDIYLWPLFEGQVLTAGIMGIVPGLRYLLVTPALLATMNLSEIESVLAHEIGHVKKRHLLLYILLFLGFSLLAGAFSNVMPFFLLGSNWYYQLLESINTSPENLLVAVTAAPILILMIVYFRFVFGYFIRNFERQADCYVFKAMGTAQPLISSFEKIAGFSGNIREEKNWHHFGIGERIRFLEKCENNRSVIGKHDRKVYLSLAFYIACILSLSFAAYRIDTSALASGYEQRYMEAVLEQKLRQEPNNSLWLRLAADLMQEKKMEKKAINAYQRAMELEPLNAEIQNNLAWLLLTAQDRNLRDSEQALTLARSAATLKQEGYILDTLATAYWANRLTEEAISTELKAMKIDPENRSYYRSRIDLFKTGTWQDSP